MVPIIISGQTFKLPENWHEVELKKIPELLKYLYVLPENGSTYHNILRIILGYSEKEWKKLMYNFFGPLRTAHQLEQSTESLRQVLNLLSWMWKSDLIKQPFEKIQVNGTPWFLFQEGLESMSFGELSDAYINAQAFVKQLIEGPSRLNMLVATVCRPERKGAYEKDPDWNGDKREDYNVHIAKLRAYQLSEVPPEQKIMILVYFMGSLKDFLSYFDLVDNTGSAPPVPEEYPGQSMIKNQHLLSEKHIFGGMKATRDANVYDVFQFLEEHHKDVQAEIARQKANQNN